MSGEAVLSVEDLAVRYGAQTVLEGVSFQVPRGSVFALLGRNGSGKSSLVRCALACRSPLAEVCDSSGRTPGPRAGGPWGASAPCPSSRTRRRS